MLGEVLRMVASNLEMPETNKGVGVSDALLWATLYDEASKHVDQWQAGTRNRITKLLNNLQRYDPKEREVIRKRYRGHRFITMVEYGATRFDIKLELAGYRYPNDRYATVRHDLSERVGIALRYIDFDFDANDMPRNVRCDRSDIAPVIEKHMHSLLRLFSLYMETVPSPDDPLLSHY